jgi:hypothetical protein
MHFGLEVFSHIEGRVQCFLNFPPEGGALVMIALNFCSPAFGSGTAHISTIDGNTAGLFGVVFRSSCVLFHLLHRGGCEDVNQR